MQATRILLNKAGPTASAAVSQVARRTKISTGITGQSKHVPNLNRLTSLQALLFTLSRYIDYEQSTLPP